MNATLTVGKDRIDLTDFEWELLKKFIIKDTLDFWEGVTQEVDGGLLPPELSGSSELIDRNILFSLKQKLIKVLWFWNKNKSYKGWQKTLYIL